MSLQLLNSGLGCFIRKQNEISRITHPFKRSFMDYLCRTTKDHELLVRIRQPLDLRPAAIKGRVELRRFQELRESHTMDDENFKHLGANLATAHLITSHGGAIKWEGSNEWIDENHTYHTPLPTQRVQNLFIEAIDASGTSMMYETFETMLYLKKLKYLDISSCQYINEWCLDRLVHFQHTLQYLNVSNCASVKENGLGMLHKIPSLKRLVVCGMTGLKQPELTLLALEEMLPNCLISTDIDYTNSEWLNQPSGGDVDLDVLKTAPCVLLDKEYDMQKSKLHLG